MKLRLQTYIFARMKFYEKYPQLREKQFLVEMLSNTVFSTMALENQDVPMSKIKEIVLALLRERELEGTQFFTNQKE